MPDNFLLVPMQVDALVLNQEASVATPFLRFQMEYNNLSGFNTPEPAPFNANRLQPGSGIYLHWTLPKSLRHGIHKEDGTTEFPLIPNRWLLVRTQGGVAPNEAVKAWVLESDYMDAPGGHAPGTTPYINPGGLGGGITPQPVKIGRALRLTPDLKSLAVQNSPFLKALGPGSATFSVYSPGVENVLSFNDDVTGNDDKTFLAQATFTYEIIGWYSDPAHDPLADVNLEWVANADKNLPGTYVIQWKAGTNPSLKNYSFDWYVYAASADLPRKMLVHTSVSGVAWNRNADNPPPPSYPTDISNKVRVSVGSTAIDALAGIIRQDKNSQAEADLLEAFQYGLLDKLDQPGSGEALNMAIREHWYGASSGGTLWTVAAHERTGDTALPAPPVPDMTPAQEQQLADLNAQQYELDRQQRILESMQWTLFSLWWKYNWQNQNNIPDPDLTQWMENQLQLHVDTTALQNPPVGTNPAKEILYVRKVQAQLNLVAHLTGVVKAASVALSGSLAQSGLNLKPVNMPQFYYPNDPVVLVTGLGRSTNLDPSDGLMCRLPSQTLSSLTVGGTTYTTNGSGGTNIQNQIPVLADPHNLLPDAVQQLHAESLFLSPCLFARDILNDPTPCPPPANTTDTLADEVRAALKPLLAPPAKDAQWPPAGGHFGPLSFAAEEWAQPWVPLLLDWQVTVLQSPAYTSPQFGPNPNVHLTDALNQGNWTFDGTNYKWTGPTNPDGGNFSEPTQMQLSGRTFITPHLTFTLADQLDAYVKTHQLRDPNMEALLKDLDKYIDDIVGQDILSQRLSGMMAMMVERQFIQNVAPSGDIAKLLGQSGAGSDRDYRHGYPMPMQDERETFSDSVPFFNFAPMAGSFFVFNGLTVIDSFGRSINLLLGNYSQFNESQAGASASAQTPVPENYFYPITGRNMRAPTPPYTPPAPNQGVSSNPAQRMVQLTPRAVQDSRLEFRLLSNDGKNHPVDAFAGANPVCGWIVPNHLDRSLAMYAPDGVAWGEVYLSKQEGDAYLPAWQPDPTNKNAPQSVADIPNPYVSNMLQVLDARTDNGLGFYDFLQVIDETLWTINPRGQRSDQNLSVLVGRPLAIVRARLSLQMRGLPFYRQDWWDTFDINLPPPDPDDTTVVQVGAVDGGVSQYLWPVRLGSHALRDDGVVGYYLDDPTTLANSFKSFNTVNLPAGIKTDYLTQIGASGNYLQLKFVDDSVSAPDPKQKQVCDITMLVDPRGQIHAFTGLLPVVTMEIPSRFVTPALQKMYYTFRSGPILTSPDEVRLPRPAERQGVWEWFDHVANATVKLKQADALVRLPATPPLAKEGWLKFTPNPPLNKND